MCSAFAAEGHDVTLYARPGDPELTADHFSWYGVEPNFRIEWCRPRGTRRLREWTYAADVRRKLNSAERFDLCYGRHLPSLALAAGQFPFVYEAHQPPSRSGRLIERHLFRHRRLQHVVCISEALRQHYLDSHPGLTQDRIMTAHDAVSCDPQTSDNFAKQTSENVLKVGYSGSLHPARGIELILQLAAELPDLQFHLCGPPTEHLADLQQRAAKLRNAALDGYLKPSEVAGWQQSMDVLLAPYQRTVPTVRWMSPLKIFEFMASGVPFVASDLPVLREVLGNDRNALLAESGQVSDWVDCLQRLRDSALRQRLAHQARHDVQTRHTWRQRARRVLNHAAQSAAAVGRDRKSAAA